MRIVLPNGVDFDILRVVHINKFFVNIGAVSARMVQRGVDFARLVADL